MCLWLSSLLYICYSILHETQHESYPMSFSYSSSRTINYDIVYLSDLSQPKVYTLPLSRGGWSSRWPYLYLEKVDSPDIKHKKINVEKYFLCITFHKSFMSKI